MNSIFNNVIDDANYSLINKFYYEVTPLKPKLLFSGMTDLKQVNKKKAADKSRGIRSLKTQRWKAVEKEDYKVAAKLRDQIQQHQQDLIQFLANL